MSIHRSHQQRRERQDAARTRIKNKTWKDMERARREARMLDVLRAGGPPYSPAVMSWLSRRLDKKAGKITPEDVKTLLV